MQAEIRAFIEKARGENLLLELNGAAQAAVARARVLFELEAVLSSAGEATVTVREAADHTGVAEETIRRAVRDGEIVDLRSNPRGTMRIRVSDLDYLKGKRRKNVVATSAVYDANAHAKRLLQAI